MDSLCCTKCEFDFHYQYNNGDDVKQFKHLIKMPLNTNVTGREYAFMLMKLYNVPEYFEDDIIVKLENFIQEKMNEIQSNQMESAFKSKEKLMEKAFRMIEKLNTDQLAIDQNKAPKNHLQDDNFYMMYHKIIHSGVLTQQLIQLENHNSEVIKNLINAKDEALRILSTEHNKEIEDALISGQCSEREINNLTQKNIRTAEKVRSEWIAKINNVRNNQKKEFYTWIKNTYEDLLKENNSKLNSFDNDDDDENKQTYLDFANVSDHSIEMEESYTINLGSQLKTTHNLRLIAADILKFCGNLSKPHRLQTAMSLYSNSLSAVVLLVDSSLNSTSTIKSDFGRLIYSTSENHFFDFDSQLNLIKSDIMKLKQENFQIKERNGYRLNAGDVYVTRHSNLSEAHVVFHIVTNDSIKNTDITSRHPVILGLRNILKIAYIYDISNIYMPLLLLHQMYEDITIQWCLRRAELILKCVKGFMIEMSSLLSISDNENKTIQFVVPNGISQELFSSLSAIFPTIFRLSNPLVLTSSNN